MKFYFQKKTLFLISLIFILFLNINFLNAEITIGTEELEEEILIESIGKTYELTSAALEKGFSINLNQKDALRLKIQGRNYYLIVQNISNNQIFLIAPGNRQLILGMDQRGIIDVNQDGELDVDLIFQSLQGDMAKIFIKEFIEEKPLIGDYIQLFDIEISLAKNEIFSTNDLNIFIKFINFGEGPSEIDVTYSILDENKSEIYTGIDSKIVYTEDSIIKNFNFLEIPPGKYSIVSKITYGKNQTAESEETFELKKRPLITVIMGPLIFGFIILVFFVFLKISHKYYETKKLKKSAKEVFKRQKQEFIIQ